MKLAQKLFLSYVVVVVTGLLVLSAATAFVAPGNFTDMMHHMRGMGSGMMSDHLTELEGQYETAFRQSVNNALLVAGIVAILAALVVSWFVSQQLTRPLRSLVTHSQQIAGGSYRQRLKLDTHDEFAELVESFNRMAEALASTEAMRVQLIGDVSHELKTPLAGIKGYMEGLQDGVLPATPETFQLIHREADRLQRLVQDLQELSRTESGQVTLDIRSHPAQAIVNPVVERMRPQFVDKTIEFDVQIATDLPAVQADCDRAIQILTNLLGNALLYTPNGGQVRLAVHREPGAVCFSVTDTGIGLTEEALPHVFQRFYRVDKSRSRGSGGTGIGLTVAKHLVEAQGGQIGVASAGLGQGSHFWFTLPAA